MRKKILTDEQLEQEREDIVRAFEQGEFKSVPNARQEIRIAQQAARNYLKRDARINIRISYSDLGQIKRLAVNEGIPYQTLLAGVAHKVANGQIHV